MPRHVNERYTVKDLTNWDLALIAQAISWYIKHETTNFSETAKEQANALVDKINAVGV